ncbi:hypothetical protein C0583_06025 [Candidatus Parcubacteria bacterium]|nr:MAG: hypothetical protein C0583_06025 [Candidatus Parcubacteria bacterium]
MIEKIKIQAMKDMGILLKTARINNGISQKTLADKMELTSNYIALVEGGKKNLSFETLIKMLKTLEFEMVITLSNPKIEIKKSIL